MARREAERLARPSRGGRIRVDSRYLVVAVAILVAMSLPARPVGAQEVELGWSGNADFGLTLTRGNSETTNLSLGTSVQRRLTAQKWSLNGALVRATTDGEETANRGDLRLQYDYFPNERFFLFARAAGGFNRPAGIDLRLSPGGGVGYELLASQRATLNVEIGGTWIRDEFLDGSVQDDLFLSLSQALTWSVSETTDVEESFLFEPNSAELEDYHLTAAIAVSTMITGALGLKVTVRDEFDSEPFVEPGTGVQREKNDLTLVTGVTLKF